MVTFTPNKVLSKPANNEFVDTWDVPVNSDWDTIDAAFGGLVTINVVAASGTVAITAAQYKPRFIVLSGLLTASVNYQFPSGVGGQWYVFNTTTGAFTITFSSVGAGTSVVVGQGSQGDLICDATNVRFGSAAAGANADITSLSGLTTPLSVPQGGTGKATITASALQKGAGTAALADAVAGTDYARPDTDSTWTGKETFNGTSAKLAAVLTNAAETATISATAATGTITIYPSSQSVLYFTSSAAANWIVNFAFSVGTSLDTALAAGQSITMAFLVTQGSTAFFNTAVQIDGTTSGVTTKWIGGTPVAGGASGVDIYSYAILKTGSAAWTVIGSLASAA